MDEGKLLDSVDRINHPKHYTAGNIEPIDVIEDWKLGYHLGCVIKYIARAPYKGTPLEDLKKARWYLDRLIAGYGICGASKSVKYSENSDKKCE